MKVICKNNVFTLFILFMKCYYSYGACPPLISTTTTTVTCKHNNQTLDNCINPLEGTEAYLTCKMFYEESTLEENPKRLCREDKWDSPIYQCYPICGKRRSKKSSKRWNDQKTLLQNPWHVGIYDDDGGFVCDGTLIGMNTILTAAGLFDFNINSTEKYFVGAGKYYFDYDDKREKFAQYSEVYKGYVPEEYLGEKSKYAFDIALLVLKRPFLPSEVVQPACIDFDLSPDYSLLESNGIVSSWGYTYKSREFNDVLRNLSILYIPHSKCYSITDNEINKYITLDKICGKYLDNGVSLCKVDVGSGLIYKNKINDRYYLIGTNSLCSSINTWFCEARQHAQFTVISQHRDFLKNHTANVQIRHSCRLPSQPSYGEYVLNKSGTFAYASGYLVPSYSRLTLTCSLGYNFTSPGATEFYCSNNGQWNPNLSGCTVLQNTALSTDKVAGFNSIIVIVIVAVPIVFVALVVVLFFKLKFTKERELRREIKAAGLDCFHKGDLNRFNPELGIDDQAELLPYNNNYEFPRDKLKLGKQIGSGAFGIVIKADAFGIIINEEKTTVAVKTVKNIADYTHIKVLIAELKVMVHLGQHLNVVNLLGACTQNISKRELFVIIEYCQFGNLYNYLLQNRQNYIDQIDHVSRNIDYYIGNEDLANFLVHSNSSRTIREPDFQHSSCLNTVPNYVSNTIYNNTNKDDKERKNQLYTKDLISWSFQVACGMEYLTSKKILHGDLAARNILLAEHNIVKICDFGLAKRMYHSSNYKKQIDCPLPIKWLAIESIRDRVFSTQSDVWSYGIVLWELFSLAQTPYPGMEIDESLYYKLKDGYRMESPRYAPKAMYEIMCHCWNINPVSRPSFNELVGTIGLMLDDNVRQHYIDLTTKDDIEGHGSFETSGMIPTAQSDI